MDLNDFFDFIERIKELMNSNNSFKFNFNFPIFIVNICLLMVIFILYYDLKPRDIFKDRKYLILITLISFVDFIMEILVGSIPLINSILSFFLVNILFLFKDKELFKLFHKTKDKEKDIKYNEIQNKIDSLDKEYGDLNILDVLYVYDYITTYQRRKVIQDMIYNDENDMVTYLSEKPTITDEELKEARAILNLIHYYNKIITKEEAMLYLIDLNTDKANKEERNVNDD